MKNIIIIVFAIIIGCDTKVCTINYINDFKSEEPLIYITSQNKDNKCYYNIKLYISFSDITIYSKGLLFYDDNAFYIKSYEPESSFFKFFDFSKDLGENYDIEIEVNDTSYKLIAIVDKIVTWNGNKIFAFRFFDSFRYFNNEYYDSVILASVEYGIVGSYISGHFNNKEFMIEPTGIVQELEEYSNLEIRELK
jgi:hypothetical protein